MPREIFGYGNNDKFLTTVCIFACGVAACGGELQGIEPAPDAPGRGTGPGGLEVRRGELVVHAFAVPGRGPRELKAGPDRCPIGASRLAESRAYVFAAGATERAISSTGKTICFGLGGAYHCHVSGTSTGFCSDWRDNLQNALELGGLGSPDGSFVRDYVAARAGRMPRPTFNISGHSQGGPDAAQVADLLAKGDQLTLLQPAASALYAGGALRAALARGAAVNVAWSEGDEASLAIRKVNWVAGLPLIALPRNVSPEAERCGVRLHNAPNARHAFLDRLGVPAGYTINPALDASVISNPGSPCVERGNIALSCPAEVPWRCPAWRGAD